MEVTGRLTNDAEVKTTTNNRQLVAFTIAVNDSYKSKDGEVKEFTEYINCSYWLSTKIADSLQKGAIVTVTGRIYLNEYKDKEGKHHANLAFHANAIKIIAWGGKRKEDSPQNRSTAQKGTPETIDDLPF